jgi:hypothetical protein
LVTTLRVGNQKHYQANANSPIFHELAGTIAKTVDIVEPLRNALVPLSAVGPTLPEITELENLARIGKLRKEPGARAEIAGLIASGVARMRDAENETLSFTSRFDLAYNAAHALLLAALLCHGYRSDNQYPVF